MYKYNQAVRFYSYVWSWMRALSFKKFKTIDVSSCGEWATSWQASQTVIMLSETGQMEMLPQTVESNLSLDTFTREGHQTPSVPQLILYCNNLNKIHTKDMPLFLVYSEILFCLFRLDMCHSHPHLQIWDWELPVWGQVVFGDGAL